MTEQKEKPKRNTKVTPDPSPKLLELIASLPKPDFRKLKERVDDIFKLAREEGHPDNAIRILIERELEPHYSESTIRRVLPSEAKANTVAINNAGQGGRPKEAINLIASEHETASQSDTTEQEPEAEETETIGTENTAREDKTNFDNYFKIIDSSGKEYAINSKKLKDVSPDIKDKMITQLIGGMEYVQGELEKSLKQVEDLRKQNTKLLEQLDRANKLVTQLKEKAKK